MTTFYDILGLQRNATEEEIKSAYKRKALEHHPDKGGNKEEFQRVKEAYETLIDPVKRQQYDNPHQPPNLNDLFGHPFFHHHQQQSKRKGNKAFTCSVTLGDVYTGIVKRFKVKRERLCEKCNEPCYYCKGTGNITQQMQLGPFMQIFSQACEPCKGTGLNKKNNSPCTGCNGKSRLEEERLVEVVIEKGMVSGKQIFVEGWGEQANKPGEENGHLVITVIVEDHPHFQRVNNGADLIYKTKITLLESIVGKVITIPHFGGDLAIQIGGFGVINPMKKYTVFGKGLETGNLHIVFDIEYPEGVLTISNEEREVLNRLLGNQVI